MEWGAGLFKVLSSGWVTVSVLGPGGVVGGSRGVGGFLEGLAERWFWLVHR